MNANRGAALLLALALPACGSTVQSRGAAAPAPAAEGLAAPSVPGATAGGVPASGPDAIPGSTDETEVGGFAPSTGGGGSAADPGVGGGSPAPGQPPASGRPGLRATYPGVTPTSIAVGVSISGTGDSAGEAVGEAFGVAGFSRAPERPLIEAMVKHVNERGGVLGRRLVPVFHTIDGADSRPYAQQSQEACAKYTEDNKVFAHLNVVSDPTFLACMEQRRTVGVERRTIGSDVVTRGFRGVFTVSDLDYTTAMSLTVRSLVRQGFLTKTSVIGVLQTDTPDFDRVRADGVERELARAGLQVARLYRVTPVQGTSDAATAVRDAQAAVLQFASAGVDRVLFVQPNGALFDIAFMQQAEQQGYRPDYGLSSHDGPVALVGGNAPQAQLDGSRGVGWAPYDDFTQIPKGQESRAAQECIDIFTRAGLAKPADRGQQNQYLSYCATFRLFATIAIAAGPELTRDSFIAAGERLGSAYDDPFAIGGASFRGPGLHEGVTAWQPLAYGTSCDCFQPTGPVERLR